MKRTWPVLLGLLLLAAPAAVQAQNDFEYTTNADGISVTITGYTGPGGDVAIPTNFDDLTVTGIGTNAFAGTDVTIVMIPGSVTSIGEHAFSGCFSLGSVTIPGSVTNVGEYAFGSCGLTNVLIPGSVISIGYGVFTFCTSLEDATISNGVTSIEATAFIDCVSLTNVTIPDSVTNIGENAFGDCPRLSSVTIPGSVVSIGEFAFENCTSLAKLTVANGVTDIMEGAFSGCTGLTSVTIPGSVTNIDDYAFDNVITNVFFVGNAPAAGSAAFSLDTNATVYYLPGTTGWGNIFSGLPTLLWDPVIQASGASFGVSNNQFGFNITATNNLPLVVEASTNLASPVWTALKSLTLTNGLFYFSDPQWTNYSERFYRISSP